MSVQFLLYVIAVLLFAVFWELCKIKSLLKRSFPSSAGHSPGPHTTEPATAKAMD